MMFKKKDKPVKRKKNIVQDYIEAILFAFVVAMIIRNFTFQNFKIPSSSMESTLLIGDYLVANKLAFAFSDPEREDIVTFRYPADPDEPQPRENFIKLLGPVYWDKDNMFFKYHARKNVVKRVIGVAGDKVEIKNGVVYLNDEIMQEDYSQRVDSEFLLSRYSPNAGKITWNSKSKEYMHTHVNYGNFSEDDMNRYDNKVMGDRDNFGPVVVPPGSYFVLGDNRDMSKDSRYWGFLNREDITGSPAIIFFSSGQPPVKSIREYIRRQNGMENPGHSIRWNRILRLIK